MWPWEVKEMFYRSENISGRDYSIVSFLKAQYYISLIFISCIGPISVLFKLRNKKKMSNMVPVFKELTIWRKENK